MYDGTEKEKLPDKLYGFAYQGILNEELPAAVTALKLVLEDDEENGITLELGRLEFKEQYEKIWNTDRLREDTLIAPTGATPARLVLRDAPSSFAHRHQFIVDWKTSTQLYVLDSPHYVFVTFRGTDPASFDSAWNDLATDLNGKRQLWMYDGTFEGTKAAGRLGFLVHRGFGTAFDAVRDELRDQLLKYTRNAPGKPIFVTGHSLGGALAALCGCYLRSHPVLSGHPLQLYTYAQPRICVRAMAEHYWRDPQFNYYRMANFADLVTMVPSRYVADEVADMGDLLLDGIAKLPKDPRAFILAHLIGWQAKEELRKRLHEMCPPELDFRHFGNLVLCGVDATNHPFAVEIGKDLPRTIEHDSNPKLQSIKRSDIGWHPMGHYRRLVLRAFEQHAAAYLHGTEAELPFSAPPYVSPLEVQLFHRYVHDVGVPTYHSMEDYREGFR